MKLITNIHEFERGLLFRDGNFVRILGPGKYPQWTLGLKHRVDIVSVRDPLLRHADVDIVARKCGDSPELRVLNVQDTQRVLVFIDGRFEYILGRGLYAFWTVFREVTTEVVDTADVRFRHPKLKTILAVAPRTYLEQVEVAAGHTGLLYVDGAFREQLAPGEHVFWKDAAKVRVQVVDLREQALDIAGQDIMTADKVTLRLNAQINFRVTDPRQAHEQVEEYRTALYRAGQLVLREAIGARTLDELLSSKDVLSQELIEALRAQSAGYGLQILALGIRDLILPGDMKMLLNKVIEAQKAAEASLITRREETAGMRSQANTAKILENNPTLMRLRELETLEKVSEHAKINVVLGDQGLSERITHLI